MSETKLQGSSDAVSKPSWRFERSSDDDGLKLIVAFLGIYEADRRQEILDLAERYRANSLPPASSPLPAVRQDNHPLSSTERHLPIDVGRTEVNRQDERCRNLFYQTQRPWDPSC